MSGADRDLRRALQPNPGTTAKYPTLNRHDGDPPVWYLTDQGRRVYLGAAGCIGYADRDSDALTTSDTFEAISDLAVTVTMLASRRYRLSAAWTRLVSGSGTQRMEVQIWDATGSASLRIGRFRVIQGESAEGGGVARLSWTPPSDGDRTLQLRQRRVAGTSSIGINADSPIELLIEDVGHA